MGNQRIDLTGLEAITTEVDTFQLVAGRPAGRAIPHVVEKTWGEEIWYANSPLYCMKLLRYNPNTRGSLHFHLSKHETFLVVGGLLLLNLIRDKKEETLELVPGQAFVVPPGTLHSLGGGPEGCLVVETSTQHFEDDSIKVK